jgi:large subunit ribosomal protein L10
MNDQTQKISENKQKKEVIVAEMTDMVTRSRGMVFTNYTGLTHQQLETIKRAVKKLDGNYVAVKNTLLLRALSDVTLADEDKKKLENPTAALFMYNDVVEPLKIISKMMKETEKPTIKFGIFDGIAVSDKDVLRLSTLPSKDVLRAQLLGQMMSPIQGLHRALSWNMQQFVMTLSAIAQKKS